jgi:murein L,D-transpeptidase YcbB/YkuD
VLTCLCSLSLYPLNRFPSTPSDAYERTQTALERYRALAAEDDGESLPEIVEPVRPGEMYDGLPRLIRLLLLVGDLPIDIPVPDSNIYGDASLVAAVKRFQRRHGLEASGRIDKATVAQLNVPLSFRVRQLEVALERWRRHPYDPSRPAIVLNLPEFRLRAFRANRMELEMKIVVGHAVDRQTPLLSALLDTVIFRPYWNVPLDIQRDELLPRIGNDDSYLAARHLDIITPQGTVLKGVVSDGVLDELRSGRLRLRQAPGPGNALGLVKFVFPNPYDVYMHGTPAVSLFSRSRRDFSHGCIRVEKPEDLAEWVLRDEPGWQRERIGRAMKGAASVTIKLRRPIQVVTTYVTAVVLDSGEVHFYDDIYRQDAALEEELIGRGELKSR